jgi:hypothetical protein
VADFPIQTLIVQSGLNGLMDYVTFTLIVDDIVWPDGHTAMARLGGGGPQTAFAVRMWTSEQQTVGLAAGVGDDLPELCKVWLRTLQNFNVVKLYVTCSSIFILSRTCYLLCLKAFRRISNDLHEKFKQSLQYFLKTPR